MNMSSRRRLAVSFGAAVVVTGTIGSVAEFTENRLIRAFVRPFALMGFALGNVHQGSYPITFGLLFATVFVFVYLSLCAIVALRRVR